MSFAYHNTLLTKVIEGRGVNKHRLKIVLHNFKRYLTKQFSEGAVYDEVPKTIVLSVTPREQEIYQF